MWPLSLRPPAQWTGAETIVFTATDAGLLFDDDTATFTVTVDNDPPIVAGIPDQTIARGGSFRGTINLDDYVTDPDDDDQHPGLDLPSDNVDLSS